MVSAIPNTPASFAASLLSAQSAAIRAAQRAFVDAASASSRYWTQSATAMLAMGAPQQARVAAASAFGPAAEKMSGGLDVVKEGFESTFTRTVTAELIEAFGEASGDVSRLHYDDAYAKRTQFGGRIGHGLLTASFISAALSRIPGTIVYLSQDLKFLKPVKPGDVITARVTVVERPPGKSWARLRTTCTLANGEPVLEGEAKVLVTKEPEG